MPATEPFDDPYEAMSSTDLDDLALGGEGDSSTNDNAAAAGAAPAAVAEEEDPWAVLAAAAGEEAPPPAAATVTADANTAYADAADTLSTPGIAVEQQQRPPSLAHARGENFAVPSDSSSSGPPSLAAQIQSSTANLLPAIQTKIAEIDDRSGISTRAKTVDSQYRISEKWSDFQTNVWKPAVDGTVTKTKEVSGSVKEKVIVPLAPSVKEGWGNIKQRTVEMGVAQKWSSVTSAVGSRWNETRESVGRDVGHWKEEQERKKAVANAQGNADYAGGNITNGEAGIGGGMQMNAEQQLEGAKEKVVESWTGGVNWVSQRIKDAKLQHEQQVQEQQEQSNREMSRLDSDGLPSSFRKD